MTDQSWCLSGELQLAGAQNLETVIEQTADERGEFPPTLSYFEQPNKELWRVEIYFPAAPDYGFINLMLARADLLDWEHAIAPIEEKDWVSESQKLLAPVEAGDFLVFGSHDKDKAKQEVINLQIDAGQAFGTGKHETTAGCLEALTTLKNVIHPSTVLDLGTGSGVLALAAFNLWPDTRVVASDIDPIAVDVTGENIQINNGIIRTSGEDTAGIALVIAAGLDDPAFEKDRPFNLITANILAGPLIDMAASIADALAHDGALILSGLLTTQEKEVLDAYQARGLVSQGRIEKGDWVALTLRKP
jgi:ribosomal protein L11 methyltransferase